MINVGERLKKVRESRGLSVYEISMTLKINAKVLIAIESDDFKNPILPSRIFIRGFIKSYSQLLKIDSEELLIAFDQTNDLLSVNSQLASQASNSEKEKAQFLEEPELPWKKILVLIVTFLTLVIVVTIARTLIVNQTPVVQSGKSEGVTEPQEQSNSVATSTTIEKISSESTATTLSPSTTLAPASTTFLTTSSTTSTTTTTLNSLSSAPIEVVIEADGDLKISYGFGDQVLQEINLTAGQLHRFKVKSKIRLEISNSKLAIIYVNGQKKDFQSAPGQVLKLEIP